MTSMKPCPYCGSRDLSIYAWPGDLSFVLCLDPHCGNEGPKAETRLGAIAKWDRRPEEDRLLKLLGYALREDEK